MTDIEIKEVQKEDWQTILNLLEKNDLYTVDFEKLKRNFILAIDKGQIVGCTTHKVLDLEKGIFEIRSVLVVEGYRERDIATKLVKSKMEHWKEKGVNRFYAGVNKENKPAVGLFEKLGFGRVSRQEVYGYLPVCNECRGDFNNMQPYCRRHSDDGKCPVDTYRLDI